MTHDGGIEIWTYDAMFQLTGISPLVENTQQFGDRTQHDPPSDGYGAAD